MNREAFRARRDYVGLVHGVTLKAIRAFGDEDLDFRPKPGMRTPRELIFHIYGQQRMLAEAARDGRFDARTIRQASPEDTGTATTLTSLRTVQDLLAFARACHQAAEEAVRGLTDEELARSIDAPFGTYPAWRLLEFGYDELWHHRGQLYTYLRLLGREPPMLYDYEPTAG